MLIIGTKTYCWYCRTNIFYKAEIHDEDDSFYTAVCLQCGSKRFIDRGRIKSKGAILIIDDKLEEFIIGVNIL
jgi:hypothetical protein